jgi:hypothetical protein
MAGSKTRFGFVGDGSEPPDSEESRAARTVYGHDIHLQLPPGFVPPRPPGSPTPLPPAPPGWTRQQPTPVQPPEQEMAEVMPARSPYRPHTSRLARFFGRWTGSGRFVPRSRMGDDDDENLELPRDTTGRNVLLVLVVAILTFSLTFAIVRLRQQSAATTPGAKAQLSAIPQPPPATPPPTPAAAPPAPLPPPPAAQIPVKPSFPAPPAPSAASKGLGPPPPEPSAQHPKAARTSAHSAEPPTHLKGELLPLGP